MTCKTCKIPIYGSPKKLYCTQQCKRKARSERVLNGLKNIDFDKLRYTNIYCNSSWEAMLELYLMIKEPKFKTVMSSIK